MKVGEGLLSMVFDFYKAVVLEAEKMEGRRRRVASGSRLVTTTTTTTTTTTNARQRTAVFDLGTHTAVVVALLEGAAAPPAPLRWEARGNMCCCGLVLIDRPARQNRAQWAIDDAMLTVGGRRVVQGETNNQ